MVPEPGVEPGPSDEEGILSPSRMGVWSETMDIHRTKEAT
jgi:hypothetical protein